MVSGRYTIKHGIVRYNYSLYVETSLNKLFNSPSSFLKEMLEKLWQFVQVTFQEGEYIVSCDGEEDL